MVQDTGSGIASIADTSVNAVTVVGAFAPGTTASVLVDSKKVNQFLASSLALKVTDVAGNVKICDPVVPGALRRAHYAGMHRLSSRAYVHLAKLRRG